MAGFAAPRRHVNPKLRDAVRASGRPGWQIAQAAGFVHHSKFSILINAESVPATPINISRLERIAAEVGFDKAQLFVEGAR